MHHIAGDRASPLITGIWQQKLLSRSCKEKCHSSVILTRTEVDYGTITGPSLTFLSHQCRCLLQYGMIVNAPLPKWKRTKISSRYRKQLKTVGLNKRRTLGTATSKTRPNFNMRAREPKIMQPEGRPTKGRSLQRDGVTQVCFRRQGEFCNHYFSCGCSTYDMRDMTKSKPPRSILYRKRDTQFMLLLFWFH